MKHLLKKAAALLLILTLFLSACPVQAAGSLASTTADFNYQFLQNIIDLYLETSLYETSREELIDDMLYNYLSSDPQALAALANALLSTHDPYSSYYRASSGFMSGTNKSYGVVITDSQTFTDGRERKPGVYVESVLRNSNAEFAGILPGDRFVSVEGVNVEGLSVTGLQNFLKLMPLQDKDPTLSAVYNEFSEEVYDPERFDSFIKLNWDPSKEVTMVLERTLSDGSLALVTLSLPRGTSSNRDIFLTLDKETGTAVIEITAFDETSAVEDFLSAFQEARDAGCTRLMIDLRDNPGGYVEAAQELGSYFTPEIQPMYYTRSRKDSEPVPVMSTGNYIGDAFEKYVVLINENTASAAELLAYILQSQTGAVLIGETSYGKAVGQDAYTVTNGDSFTITSFEILRTDLTSYNEKGLEPDVYIPLTREKYPFPTGLSHFNHENYVEIQDGVTNDATLALEQRFGILDFLREDAIDGTCDSSTRAAIYLYRALVMREKTPGTDVTFDMVTSVTNTINRYKDYYVYTDSQLAVARLYLENASRGKRLATEYINAEKKLTKLLEEKARAEEEANRKAYWDDMATEREQAGEAAAEE